MIKRLIPLTLALFATLSAFAQVPQTVNITGEYDPSTYNPSLVVTCPMGVSAFAGTSTQALDAAAQSNNVEFLCLNDVLDITHLGGQTFGDPDPSTDPGVNYAFYTCLPTITGVDFASILADPCHLNPNFPIQSVTVVQAGIDILGNTSFNNSGFLQNTYNTGDPFELFFAPITLDDFANFLWENDGVGGPNGPCIHANVNDAFRVVYLNAVEGLNIDNAANGPCGGSFELAGGLPEFDNSNYTNLSISLTTDPTVTANISVGPYTHGDVVNFTVTEPGIYNVVLEDGRSCAANFTIDMSACTQLETNADDVVTLPGQTVCVEVTANSFTDIFSFQYTINYDPTILDFTTINPIDLPADLLFAEPSAGNITVSWSDATLPLDGVTLADGTVLYEICFMAIGAVGETSPIDFSGSLTPIEVTTTDGMFNSFVIGHEFTSGSVTISSNSITLELTSCSTTSNMGTITVTSTGGAAPFSVAYVEVGNVTNNGMGIIPTNGGSFEFTGLTPGTYDIGVTDANGDVQSATITVVNTDPLLVQINETNPTCPNGTDGSMSANINGGVSPISTLWSNGGTTNIIDNLAQGMYDVTVTDVNGCTASASESIFVNSIMFDTITLDHVSCIGGNASGAIEIAASGGTGTFTYSWNTGDTGPSITNLTAGSYTVTAMDANMCSAILSINVNAPIEPIIIGFDSIPVACSTDMTGELTPVVQAGNSTVFTYQWGPNANNQITETAVGLTAGTYSITITDAAGCTAENNYTLWAPTPLMVDVVSNAPSCPNNNDGSIQLMLSGGSTPYQILWENGSSFPVLPSLACDSSYTVFVTDAGGCDTFNLVIPVDCPPEINVNFAAVDSVSCEGGIPCDGTATATASGGTAGTGTYNYTWSSGETNSLAVTSSATALCQGLQTVEVNDGLCSVMDTVLIGAPDILSFDLAASGGTGTSCFGDSDGSITVFADGGTPGYNYNWTNPVATGNTVDNLPAGNNYFVVVTDANGCTIGSTFQVTEPDILVALIDSTSSFGTSCFGLEDGQIAATSMGGTTGQFTYDWTPDVSDASTAINVGVGTYTVTVTDINGCTDDVSYTVTQPEPIFVIVADPVEPLCSGLQTVVTLDSVSGGSGPPYSFSVDFGPPQFENSAIPILAGAHTVTIFDGDGCSTEVEISVSEPLPVLVDLGPDTTIQLGDSLQLDPAIGSILPIDTLFWNPLTFLTCWGVPDSVFCDEPWVAPLETQMYELTVIDTNGCFGTDQIIVDIDKNRNVFIPNAFSPNGDGVNDFFKIYTGVGVQRVNYFRIFDRWGEQVFQDDSFLPGDFYIGGWDGRFKGKQMDNGVFVYIAEVQFVDGIVLLYRGDVTLVR